MPNQSIAVIPVEGNRLIVLFREDTRDLSDTVDMLSEYMASIGIIINAEDLAAMRMQMSEKRPQTSPAA
jgi:hypothetical protein